MDLKKFACLDGVAETQASIRLSDMQNDVPLWEVKWRLNTVVSKRCFEKSLRKKQNYIFLSHFVFMLVDIVNILVYIFK